MIKHSKRREYFACHLTLQDREKLKCVAKERSVSMSELAADFISKGLTTLTEGAVAAPETTSKEVDVPLPLEGN